MPPRLTQSLLGRLAWAYLIPTLLLVAAFGYVAHFLARRSLDEELGRRLVSVAEAAATLVRPETIESLAPGDETGRSYASTRKKLLDLRGRTDAARIQIVRPDLTSLLDTADTAIGVPARELEVDRSEMTTVQSGRSTASFLFRGHDERLYKRGYAPLRGEGGSIVAIVCVQGSASYFAELERFRRWLILFGAIGAAVVLAVSALVARRLTSPLRDLAASAERMGGGDFSSAVPVPASRDEIALLGQTLEEMRRALRARDERMQMMLSGIAHEVRNPLGGIELFLGLLREELGDRKDALSHAARIDRELGHLKRVVEEFLEYARRPPPELVAVECARLLEDVREVLASDCATQSVSCEIALVGQPAIRGDAGQLRRVLLNLGRNAIQASSAGGRITLGGANGDGRVRLFVRDDGRGIDPQHLEQVFVPFFTTKEKGTGLGLAFVREIVRDHEGTLSVESTPGRGTTFTIELPAWRPS